MEACTFNPELMTLFNWYVLTSIFLVGIACSLKDRKSIILSCVTALAFWVAFTFQCELKVIDPERVWRYVLWVGMDIVYLLILLVFYRMKIIREWQFSAICGLQVFVFFIQLIRLPDAHKFNYLYTDSFYVEAINFYNISVLVLVAIPPLQKIIAKIKEYKNARHEHSNGDNSGIFDARC